MSDHAVFAPSACYRNVNCIGAIALNNKAARQGIKKPTSQYALEGTKAHNYIAACIIQEDPYKMLDEMVSDKVMREHIYNYFKFLQSLEKSFKKEHPDHRILVEKKVAYDDDLWGTVDFALVGRHAKSGLINAVICDFKYGMGVEVDAEENEQLLCYALCLEQEILRANQELGAFNDVYCFIYQPRTPGEPYSKWLLDKETRLKEGTYIIERKRDALKILADGTCTEEHLNAGEWCRFCEAKPICSKYASYLNSSELKILDSVPQIPDKSILTLEQKVAIFERRKLIKRLLDDISAELLAQASSTGVPGYKIVAGARRRQWQDNTDHIGQQLIAMGIKNPYKQSLIGITEVEKQIGKGKIDSLTQLSKESFQLVPESDKRASIDPLGISNLNDIDVPE